MYSEKILGYGPIPFQMKEWQVTEGPCLATGPILLGASPSFHLKTGTDVQFSWLVLFWMWHRTMSSSRINQSM